MKVYSPTHGREINVGTVNLSDDPDTQVAQVLDLMVGLSDEDSLANEIQNDARAACASGEDESTAEPFTAWLKRDDIPETLVRPIDMRMMAEPQGDCDDFSMMIRARLLALGIPCKFVTVAVDPQDPERFSHVYAVADCSDGRCGPNWSGRVALDTSHGPYPGWEAPNPFGKRAEWPGVSTWQILAGVVLVAGIGTAIWWALK